MIEDKIYCASSFLTLRYIADSNKTFKKGVIPTGYQPFPPYYKISTAEDVRASICDYVGDLYRNNGETALMLSGGIDSAILARLVPKGTKAYTFRSSLPNTIDESDIARQYAEVNGLEHEIIDIDWDDFVKLTPILMARQGAPVHSISPQIHKAALVAKAAGYKNLLFGENADVIFGGHDGLLSKDWNIEEFVDRYSYVKPELVLGDGYTIRDVFERYEGENSEFDTYGFMNEHYLKESTYSYVNACEAAGIQFASPYNKMRLDFKLDLSRIISGDSKYLLRELFKDLYPDLEVRKKIPMPRAVDQYLADWKGPSRGEFKSGLDINAFTGDQKWMIYCLEWYMNLLDTRGTDTDSGTGLPI